MSGKYEVVWIITNMGYPIIPTVAQTRQHSIDKYNHGTNDYAKKRRKGWLKAEKFELRRVK